MDVISLGIMALCALLISARAEFSKKSVCALCGSIVTIIMTLLCASCWKKMLAESGKDTVLFGFYSYPAAVIILLLLLVGAAVLLTVSAAFMLRKSKTTKNKRP